MPEQENVARIRSVYDAFTRGDIAHILGLLDADVEWHAPRTVPFSKGVHRGRTRCPASSRAWRST
jgi:ketosteroid isomerase-like protein